MVARPWLWVRASAWSDPVVVQVVAADAGPALSASTASVVAAAAMTVRGRDMRGTLPQRIDQLNNVNAAARRTFGRLAVGRGGDQAWTGGRTPGRGVGHPTTAATLTGVRRGTGLRSGRPRAGADGRSSVRGRTCPGPIARCG